MAQASPSPWSPSLSALKASAGMQQAERGMAELIDAAIP